MMKRISSSTMRRRHGLAIGVFVLAVVVRLAYNLVNAHGYVATYDAGIYEHIARNLIDNHCYCVHGQFASVSRAPLWPWIIAALYVVGGKDPLLPRLFYCALGAGTCLLIYYFARDLFGRRIAAVCGCLAALYTGLFLYDGWLYTESLYTFCLLGFTYALFRVQYVKNFSQTVERHEQVDMLKRVLHMRWLMAAGCFLAAAILTRPNGSGLFAVLGLWMLLLPILKLQSWRVSLRRTVLIALLAFLLVIPWTYRNYLVTQQLVLVATGMGEVLDGAYNDKVLIGDPNQRGFWTPPDDSRIHDEINYTLADDKQQTARALDWMWTHLAELPTIFCLHFINMWKPYTYSHGLPLEQFPARLSSKILLILIPIQTWPTYLLAAVGLFLTWRRYKKPLLMLYLVLGFTILQNVIFYSTMRFRFPIEPLLIICAGGFVAHIFHSSSSRLQCRRTVPRLPA
ncbi:hypothetical protein KDA_43540 [Dictyobacter alpinus]|uniref:Glycosyltransferase RgtA/B/C/D-like domain-containing protein n=1 Tax=Dictyobacter alpinus TaxID=2014873 RepID=A0A402BC41_9CHLR|nr:glycosyltransferase family 39 protein [Dictyobacter alpinus]GCE28870.1 hypothetical protein KDA_43540 [Dictyobacter alpinus]